MSYNLGNLAKDVITNNVQYADTQLVETRRNTCLNCEFLQKSQFDKVGSCGKCGCMMHQKTKFKQSSCIIGKW